MQNTSYALINRYTLFYHTSRAISTVSNRSGALICVHFLLARPESLVRRGWLRMAENISHPCGRLRALSPCPPLAALALQFAMVVCALRAHTPLLIGLVRRFWRHWCRSSFGPRWRGDGGKIMRGLPPPPPPHGQRLCSRAAAIPARQFPPSSGKTQATAQLLGRNALLVPCFQLAASEPNSARTQTHDAGARGAKPPHHHYPRSREERERGQGEWACTLTL